MRILIVDDEKLTREGLCEGIRWDELGIDDVQLADDGQSALESAHRYPPQIVLTDVRMPRMDGIRMAELLQAEDPEVRIILMSGYSDREYLKAAIRLKAISYVEKPIMLEEVKEVVKEAVESVRELRKLEAYEQFTEDQLRKHMAEHLLQPNSGKLRQEDTDFLRRYDAKPCFSLILQYQPRIQTAVTEQEISALFRPVIESFHAEELHTLHRGPLYICHVIPQYAMNEARIAFFASLLCEKLNQNENTKDLAFHIAAGMPADSWKNLYSSYSTAVIALQKAFFRKPGGYIVYGAADAENEVQQPFADFSYDTIVEKYRRLLVDADKEKMDGFLGELLRDLTGGQHALPGQIKDLYYFLFTSLRTAEQSRAVSLQGEDSFMELASGSISVYTLHQELVKRTDGYLAAARTLAQAPSTVNLIRHFIEAHYSDPALSIKMISDHVHLSTSYICTLFKNETGTTLNQFITDYRMQKARELLLDVRNRVQEISGAVGFTDSGYFSKAFKKNYGVSPSEFRSGIEKK